VSSRDRAARHGVGHGNRANRPDSAEAVEEALGSFLRGDLELAEFDVETLIRRGESEALEFKASLRWHHAMALDVPADARKKTTKQLQLTVAKVIARFLNTDGRTLLIGVGTTARSSGSSTISGPSRRRAA
jgi:hypothetical protein